MMKTVGQRLKKEQVNVRRCRLMVLKAKRQGCMNTLAEHNEDVELELPRAWEPLDSSKPSQTCEGPSSYGVFPYGN